MRFWRILLALSPDRFYSGFSSTSARDRLRCIDIICFDSRPALSYPANSFPLLAMEIKTGISRLECKYGKRRRRKEFFRERSECVLKKSFEEPGPTAGSRICVERGAGQNWNDRREKARRERGL
jgi:hypothetical protein